MRSAHLSSALAVLLLVSRASAHLELTEPTSRYGRTVLKEGPCGKAGGQRTNNVTVLRPGSTLAVEWNEYVNHPGHYRIAFDPTGDDSFEDPLCATGCDGRTPTFAPSNDPTVLMDDIPDGTSSMQVTLPDVECDTCTLQVIQVMYDKPPQTSPGNDNYYQCADLILTRDPAALDGGAGAGADSGGSGRGASGDDGGCTMGRHASNARVIWPALGLASIGVLGRRRRRPSRSFSSAVPSP